jgi:Arc/MetJ-type ribon-helix-helix transcriptional regulator
MANDISRRPYTFYLDSDLAEGLKAIKERVGVSESEQIRRAIRQWLDSQGDDTQRTKRPSTRKR